jgi:glycosyltransferase involved in cell wall biosynthesis
MRVLHVIPAVAARYGGPSTSIAAMCRALNAQGIPTLIATTDADGPNTFDVPLGAQCSWHGLSTIFFPKQWSEAFKYSGPLAEWLDAHTREFSVVHIHAVLSHASLAAARAARASGTPYVIRPLGTLDAWSLAQKPWRKRILMALGTRQLLRDAAAIHYTSIEERRQVERRFNLSNGVVVPLGVEEAWLTSPAVSDEQRARDRYVLALSRLHPVKNLEALVDAFADLSTAGWRLVVAGTGDEAYADRLRALIVRRQAGHAIAMPGWTDGDAKRALVRQASLFALPSLHENFGVGLVEALAAGVPALVSDQVHLAETIRSAGAGWVASSSRESLRAALADALTRHDERLERAAAARDLAGRFSWTAIGAQLASMYTSLPRPDAVQPLRIAALPRS